MFTTITITTSSDSSGNQFTSIKRYDNGRKRTGMGRLYRSNKVEIARSAARRMGFHFMHCTRNGFVYGKLIA